MKSESDTLFPLKSSKVKSGAWVFISTLAMIGSSLKTFSIDNMVKKHSVCPNVAKAGGLQR
jgi:hypothetical protein